MERGLTLVARDVHLERPFGQVEDCLCLSVYEEDHDLTYFNSYYFIIIIIIRITSLVTNYSYYIILFFFYFLRSFGFGSLLCQASLCGLPRRHLRGGKGCQKMVSLTFPLAG